MTVEVGWRAGVLRLVCDDGQLVGSPVFHRQPVQAAQQRLGVASSCFFLFLCLLLYDLFAICMFGFMYICLSAALWHNNVYHDCISLYAHSYEQFL